MPYAAADRGHLVGDHRLPLGYLVASSGALALTSPPLLRLPRARASQLPVSRLRSADGQAEEIEGSARRGFVARRVILPVQAFVHTEVASSAVLLTAAVVAFAWTNSPWDSRYVELWAREISFDSSLFHVD